MQSLGASNPELVLVLEAIDERIDLTRVAQLVGLEVLNEMEQESDLIQTFREPRQMRGSRYPPVCMQYA